MDAQAKKFLNALWAQDGDRADPETLGIDRDQGWDINYEQPGTGKFPERVVFNQLFRELQGAFREHMVYGLPRWASDVTWEQHSFVIYEDAIYVARSRHGPGVNSTPSPRPDTAPTIWRRY